MGLGAILRKVAALKPKRMRLAHWFCLIVFAVAVVVGASTLVWWGAIREALMDPAVPFQTWTPPPAPDYARPASWALLPRPGTETSVVDVFFVHPTTFEGRNWNGPIDDPNAVELLNRLMIPNYAGPFAQVGRVFAPRYRQASLYTQITLREDARDARAFAFEDIKAAFARYLTDYAGDRPFIIVGVEQGALLANRLALETLTEHPEYRGRFVALYLLETLEPAAGHAPDSILPACQGRDQAHCVVGYRANIGSEDGLLHDQLRHHAAQWQSGRLVRLAEAPLLCVNPLLGATTSEPATTDHNLGAANASGLDWGDQPGIQSHQVGAQCVDGILQVTRPRSPSLRGRANWADSVRVRPYNWFYADLTADAKARVAALSITREDLNPHPPRR